MLTAVLTFASLIGYAVIYTVWLKRATPQNIVIGGAAGAAPPILGWTAVTGHVDPQALLLFLIIFVWTPPHFWALAIARRADYAKVDIPMLPVTHGVAFTRRAVLRYTIAAHAGHALPFLMRMSGVVYLGAAALLDAGFLRHALKLNRSPSDAARDARVPLFDRVSDVAVSGAAAGSLPADDSAARLAHASLSESNPGRHARSHVPAAG